MTAMQEADKAVTMVSTLGLVEYRSPRNRGDAQHVAVFKTLTFF